MAGPKSTPLTQRFWSRVNKTELAHQFGVSFNVIHKIVTGRAWKHAK